MELCMMDFPQLDGALQSHGAKVFRNNAVLAQQHYTTLCSKKLLQCQFGGVDRLLRAFEDAFGSHPADVSPRLLKPSGPTK